MITATINSQGDHTVTARFRSPSIYLDTCAICEIAKNDDLLKRMIATLADKDGTFLITYANVVEIGRMEGTTHDQIQSFLEAIGPRWFPLDCNVVQVMEREEAGVDPAPACLDLAFMKSYYPYAAEDLSLVHLIELVRGEKLTYDNIFDRASDLAMHFTIVRNAFQRKARGINPDAYLTQEFDEQHPTQYVYHGFMRDVLESKMLIESNDIFDIWHCAVPIAYANFVVTDKTWAHIAQARLKSLPSDRWIFRVAQIEECISVLERVQTGSG